MTRIVLLLLLSLLTFLGACGEVQEAFNEGFEEGLGENSVEVQRSEFGEEWPLTVERGTLECDADAVTFHDGEKVYAVNGTAETRKAGADIEEIWADNPEVRGTKKNIGVLIDRGLALCD